MPSRASRYGLNCGSSAASSADAPPDAAQAGQDRIVAFVERGVAFGAEPFDALGARQHLTQRRRARRLRRRRPAPAASAPARSSSPSWKVIRSRRDSRSLAARADARQLVLRRRASRRTPPRSARAARRARRTCRATPRWVEGSSSVWCSCCPWSSIRRVDRSFSAPAVASVAVDEGAAAALRGDLAPDQQLFAAALEDRFDRRGVFAGAHEVARRAPAEEQADGLDEDRLAGAGFARQDVQAGIEFDLDRVNHREVLNA